MSCVCCVCEHAHDGKYRTRAADYGRYYSHGSLPSMGTYSNHPPAEMMSKYEFGQGREYLDWAAMRGQGHNRSGRSNGSSDKSMIKPSGALPWKPTGRAP